MLGNVRLIFLTTSQVARAHVRRKFKEVKIAQPKGKTGKANWALNHIQKLYRVETLNKDSTQKSRRQQRLRKSAPYWMSYIVDLKSHNWMCR